MHDEDRGQRRLAWRTLDPGLALVVARQPNDPICAFHGRIRETARTRDFGLVPRLVGKGGKSDNSDLVSAATPICERYRCTVAEP